MRWEEHKERVGVGAKIRKHFKDVKMSTVSSAASFNRRFKSIYMSLNAEVCGHLSCIFFWYFYLPCFFFSLLYLSSGRNLLCNWFIGSLRLWGEIVSFPSTCCFHTALG